MSECVWCVHLSAKENLQAGAVNGLTEVAWPEISGTPDSSLHSYFRPVHYHPV